MKRFLYLLLAALLLFSCSPVLTEAEGVIVLSMPDTAEEDPLDLLSDIKIGTAIDLGDRLILPYDEKIVRANSEAQNIYLYVEVTNLAPQKQLFFKDAQVVVIYTTDRGEYKFGGSVEQGSSSRDFNNAGRVSKEIEPLYVGCYRFRCIVPNYVIDNPGPIRMEITFGEYTMTWNARTK